jgi:hypothetical protein
MPGGADAADAGIRKANGGDGGPVGLAGAAVPEESAPEISPEEARLRAAADAVSAPRPAGGADPGLTGLGKTFSMMAARLRMANDAGAAGRWDDPAGPAESGAQGERGMAPEDISGNAAAEESAAEAGTSDAVADGEGAGEAVPEDGLKGLSLLQSYVCWLKRDEASADGVAAGGWGLGEDWGKGADVANDNGEADVADGNAGADDNDEADGGEPGEGGEGRWSYQRLVRLAGSVALGSVSIKETGFSIMSILMVHPVPRAALVVCYAACGQYQKALDFMFGDLFMSQMSQPKKDAILRIVDGLAREGRIQRARDALRILELYADLEDDPTVPIRARRILNAAVKSKTVKKKPQRPKKQKKAGRNKGTGKGGPKGKGGGGRRR